VKSIQHIARDVSWLSFNERVLQEAADNTVPIQERLKFLGIFSNNMDEFYRVRIATLKRTIALQKQKNSETSKTFKEVEKIIVEQQKKFEGVWQQLVADLSNQKIHFKTSTNLNPEQEAFLWQYFDNEVESNITPLMLQNIKEMPQLREKSLYLAVALHKKKLTSYALIEVPARLTPRFVILPSVKGEQHIILLEDIIRFALPRIFSMFIVKKFESYIIKFTRDAELDIDNDIQTDIIQKLEKGIKLRRKAHPVRFVYDKAIPKPFLLYITQRLQLKTIDSLTPSGPIHNFRHFIDFPKLNWKQPSIKKQPFHHHYLQNARTVTNVIMQKDVLLQFPYHSFDAVIDLLREAAIDADVSEIKITAYRLATQSKVMNVLINAKKNGKKVIVVLELKARFDEEANLKWKTRLEEEGIEVHISQPNIKIHAKICLIKKITNRKTTHYGFISTGNINESTAKLYSDTCLLTSNRFIMADVNRVFQYLTAKTKNIQLLKNCNRLWVSPISMRSQLLKHIETEIKNRKAKKNCGIILKLNSLTDIAIINKLAEAQKCGVPVQLIIRSIYCAPITKKSPANLSAISIVDSYLEHSRIFYFNNNNNAQYYISSADAMSRNLDHRVEVATPIIDPILQQELLDFLIIQLNDNTKARIFDASLQNKYSKANDVEKFRSQEELYNYFLEKTI
jgi:polyphosphate kinase